MSHPHTIHLLAKAELHRTGGSGHQRLGNAWRSQEILGLEAQLLIPSTILQAEECVYSIRKHPRSAGFQQLASHAWRGFQVLLTLNEQLQ